MANPTPAEITKRVIYHPPNDAAKMRHEAVRHAIQYSMERFAEQLPESREASVAFTNLEQAMFWANAAIARNHDKL